MEVVAAAVAALAAAITGRTVARAYRDSADSGPTGLVRTETGEQPPPADALAASTTGEFSARMGHELRTPLNSVIGFSSVLLKNQRGNLSSQELLYLSRIRDNGEHLLALVDHLLDASDHGTGAQRVRLTPVSLERIVRGALQELAPEAAVDHVAIDAEIPAGILPLTTDEHRFEGALRSLVRSAYPLAGQGSMTVRVAAPDGRPTRIDVDVTGPAVKREPGPGATVAPLAGLTLATSLYQLLGYPVTTAQTTARGATFSVMLEQGAGAAAPAPGDRAGT